MLASKRSLVSLAAAGVALLGSVAALLQWWTVAILAVLVLNLGLLVVLLRRGTPPPVRPAPDDARPDPGAEIALAALRSEVIALRSEVALATGLPRETRERNTIPEAPDPAP